MDLNAVYHALGWNDDAAINADIAAGHGQDKLNAYMGSSGAGGGGTVAPFSFDYAAEAEKAYGELGTYYNELLTQSEGDINLAFSRLVEDYDRGVRTRTASTADQKTGIDLAQVEADRRQKIAQETTENRISRRGVGQTSFYSPDQNRGDIANKLVEGTNAPYQYNAGIRQRNKERLDLNLKEYTDVYGAGGIRRGRATVDTATKLSRKKEQLEQNRRIEAGNIANMRGGQAYNSYVANPNLV